MSVQPQLVVPGVHLLSFPIGQVYIWDWGGGVTIIDSGVAGSADAILAAVAGLGRQPEDVKEIVLTHYHDDHRGSAAELRERTGAAIVAHRLEAPVIRGDVPQTPPKLTDFERPIAEHVIQQMAPQSDAASLAALSAEELARTMVAHTGPGVDVQREVQDGDQVGVGGLVVHGPGHTDGSITVLVPGLRVLFTGDSLASQDGSVLVGVFNVDRPELLRTTRMLGTLEFDVACFGHGAPSIGGAQAAVRALG